MKEEGKEFKRTSYGGDIRMEKPGRYPATQRRGNGALKKPIASVTGNNLVGDEKR